MEGAFARPTQDVLANFGVDATRGLSDKQVIDLRSKHGKNGMRTSRPRPRIHPESRS